MAGNEKKMLIYTRIEWHGLTSGWSYRYGMDDPVYELGINLPVKTGEERNEPDKSGVHYKVTKMPEFTVVGVTKRTCNADGRSIADIPMVWREFLEKNAMAQIKNRKVPPVMYAVYSDYEKDWTTEYNFLIGCGVTRAPHVPDGLTARRIPAQTYAHFVANGPMPESLVMLWSSIWISDLPRTYTFDYEVYDQRFTRPENKEIDVYVAIDPTKIRTPQD